MIDTYKVEFKVIYKDNKNEKWEEIEGFIIDTLTCDRNKACDRSEFLAQVLLDQHKDIHTIRWGIKGVCEENDISYSQEE